jgi:hypothetical protein
MANAAISMAKNVKYITRKVFLSRIDFIYC